MLSEQSTIQNNGEMSTDLLRLRFTDEIYSELVVREETLLLHEGCATRPTESGVALSMFELYTTLEHRTTGCIPGSLFASRPYVRY